MSYDINFWKYKEGVYLDNHEVYIAACCNGKTIDGLEELPVDAILDKIAEAFSDWTRLGLKDYEKEGGGSFQIYTTGQIVRFDCYNMTGDDMNRLIDVMLEFGCPLYDPQISTRFDGMG